MPAQRKIVLTDRFLKAIKPAEPGARPIIWDATQPNFGVRVTDRGSKTFVVMRRRPGDDLPLRHTIGAYNPAAEPGGEGSLAHARAQAREALAAIVQGRHPREIEERKRREEQQRRKDTFGSVAEEFIKRHVHRLRSARANEALIQRELLGQSLRRTRDGGKLVEEWVPTKDARWRNRPITEITRRDAVELIEGIADKGSRHQARKTFAAASKLFKWAVHRSTYGLEQSPCAGIDAKELLGEFEPRARVLSDDELRLVWRATKKLRYPFGTLVRALMLSGQRLRELSDARWDEIDLDKATLTVPATRMKGKITHVVPVTPAVVDLLQGVPRFEDGAFVFTTTAGKRPVSGFSKAKSRLDREMERTRLALTRLERRHGGKPRMPKTIPAFTIHDLRRSVRTRLSELGVLPFIAEMVIGHKQAGIQAVYDLHTYDGEKRNALLQWERRLLSIVEPRLVEDAKVVPMRGGQRP
jgi:integrase